MLNDELAALSAVGCDISGVTSDERRLVVRAGDMEFVRARPSDIATCVERGAADLGIVGKDVLMESAARVLELAALRFGACRFVVAAPRDALERSLDEYRHLGSLEVATKYPRVAEEHFRRRGIQVEIVKVAGSAALARQVRIAGCVVQLVATGATLAAQERAVLAAIPDSTARLIAKPAADPLRRTEV